MTGLLYLNGKTYFFRDDSGYGGVWAWDIYEWHGCHVTTHKWPRMPRKSVVELFDVENPPQTVRYIPIMGR